jgi:hypothetical protein
MSGWMKNRETYQLTDKKMLHWHETRRCGSCRGSYDIIQTHLLPAGFTVVGRFNELAGPGLVEGSTDALYTAVSGVEHGHASGMSFTLRPESF